LSFGFIKGKEERDRVEIDIVDETAAIDELKLSERAKSNGPKMMTAGRQKFCGLY